MDRDWRQGAHLFVGFEIKFYNEENHDFTVPIDGFVKDKLGHGWFIINGSEDSIVVEGCTLIARTVDQMTEEEKKQLWELHPVSKDVELSDFQDYLRDFLEEDDMYDSACVFLYLLSIGVLPPQYEQGLKDGTIIRKEDE